MIIFPRFHDGPTGTGSVSTTFENQGRKTGLTGFAIIFIRFHLDNIIGFEVSYHKCAGSDWTEILSCTFLPLGSGTVLKLRLLQDRGLRANEWTVRIGHRFLKGDLDRQIINSVDTFDAFKFRFLITARFPDAIISREHNIRRCEGRSI